MRPRGQTPRMLSVVTYITLPKCCFNEAAGADPADATGVRRLLNDLDVLQ